VTLAAGTRYYHGGAPGLRLGALLLPPCKTGARSLAAIAREHRRDLRGKSIAHMREDRVYFGSKLEIAVLYAALHPSPRGGWVYEVAPEDPIEPDPDYRGDGSFQAPAAVIVKILGPLTPATAAQIRKGLGA
jgi:hypothetical protein